MPALRRPARAIDSQPYISSLYNAADLTDGAKSLELNYTEHLAALGREDSLEGIVVSVDDIEFDSGQTHDYSDSEGPSGSSNGDTGQADNIDSCSTDPCHHSDGFNTDNEHEHTLFQRVFSDLIDDPQWPRVQDAHIEVFLNSSDWEKLVQLVLDEQYFYQYFSFQYFHDEQILRMSSASPLHEAVSNFLGTYVSQRGSRIVIDLGDFVGSLQTDTKKMFVGPAPDPTDPSRHVQRLKAPALLVPDGSVVLRLPAFNDCGELVKDLDERVVAVIEKGFTEPWDHLVYRFGQYSVPDTLNPDLNELPVFQLAVKVFERPEYHSPWSKDIPDAELDAWRTQWVNVNKSSLRTLPPSDEDKTLTGRILVGDHTFCGELEAYLVLLDFSAENRGEFRNLYANQEQVAEWVRRGQAIAVQKTYRRVEAEQFQAFTIKWKTVFTRFQMRIWNQSVQAWEGFVDAQQRRGIEVYTDNRIQEAWASYLDWPFVDLGSNVAQVPLQEIIDAIISGAQATARQCFDAFKRKHFGAVPRAATSPPANPVGGTPPSLEVEAQEEMQKMKLKSEELKASMKRKSEELREKSLVASAKHSRVVNDGTPFALVVGMVVGIMFPHLYAVVVAPAVQ
ncbi:uncharacterized protein B0H18DRAFT_958995 [Fomitopsis serialis]|uniref:uncharacterized protein n=1 Tax=Fomitopsis serialis TaxID=139415 RepID=UPI002008AFDE|nr:uncharacterized protein B0H18DRAFT_958995 [Neoantrodia serialis]KAH9916066.1 hypothetical protein B0H18DRAFT_958995 [Neoantrodia serialis]